MENLLTRLTMSVMSRQGENVATAGLLYLLQSHDDARHAFLQVVEKASGVPLPPNVRFQGQVGSTGSGITDISGWHDNRELVIVEAKVGAGLGLNQARDYFKRLDAGGLLVVLAPESRLPALFGVACKDCDVMSDASALTASAGGKSLVAVSWLAVIDAIRAKPLTAALRAEVDQIRGLYDHLETAEFMPFSSDSLSRNAARQHASLERVVVDLNARIFAGTVTDASCPKKGFRIAASGDAVGFYFLLAGNSAWFGRSTGLWLKNVEAETPYWLHLWQLGYSDAHLLKGQLDGDARCRARCFGEPPVRMALWPPLGVDISLVGSGLAEQIAQVGAAIRKVGLAVPVPTGAAAALGDGGSHGPDSQSAGEETGAFGQAEPSETDNDGVV